jgi:hypothetical protein
VRLGSWRGKVVIKWIAVIAASLGGLLPPAASSQAPAAT